MKHRLLFTLLLGCMSIGSQAQDYTILEDLTSSKLTNYDFSADAPITETIRTYDYDMSDEGAGSGVPDAKSLYGMQPVTGWTASSLSDNMKLENREDGKNSKASGVFAYDDESGEDELPGLGGAYYAPFKESTLTGNALGMVSVWGSNLSYTQDVTLPKGAYMLVMTVYNVAGTATITNNFGYIAGEKKYISGKTNYTVGIWETDTVVFRLEKEVNGQVSLGLICGNGSGSAPHLFVDNVKLYKIDENELIQEEINKLKDELYSLIEIGKTYNVDTSASESVYNNPNSSKDDVLSAIENQKAINETGLTDLSDAFITNPHFSLDDPIVGGICTYDYDCPKTGVDENNYGQMPVYGWTPEEKKNGPASGVYSVGDDAFLGKPGFLPPTTLSDGSTEGKVLGFVTSWGGTIQYKQPVNLPSGKYTLTLSYYNAGGTLSIGKNLIGFVSDNGTEYLGSNKTFPVGKWTKEEISFELTEETSGYFSLGYTSSGEGSDKNPHFFTDGISLIYVGTGIDPTFMALKSAVNNGNKLLEEKFKSDLKSSLQEAVNAGQELINNHSTDSEVNQAATLAITSQLSEVSASITAYKNLDEFAYGPLVDALDKYETVEPELFNRIGALNDEIMEALDEYNWDNTEIETAINSLPEIIKNYTQETFDSMVSTGTVRSNDLDISVLYNTLGVKYSTNAVSGSNVPDKQWEYGNATNFKTQYGTAEVWNQSPFTVSQTLSDMPAGKYTIKVRAFYRTSDQISNYDNYNPENNLAFVFAGSQKTALTNIAELATTDPEEFSSYYDLGNGMYVPSGQQEAYRIFDGQVYDKKLLKSVNTVLVEDGDLTFGITANEMESNNWVVWYTFELYYNSLSDNDQAISDELTSLMEIANEYILNGCSDVVSVLENMGAAYEQGENALNKGNDKDRISSIKALKSAIAEADEAAKLVEELNSTRDFFETLSYEYEIESTDTSLKDLINESSSDQYSSINYIQSLISQFPSAWTSYVLGQDMTEASDNNPIDITAIIINNNFDSGNINYWTTEEGVNQKQAYQGSNYISTDGDVAIDKFIESWRQKPTALDNSEISQTIASTLPEGYYLLEVDGYAINQAGVPEGFESISGAGLMAKTGTTMTYQDMGVNSDVAVPTHWSLVFYSDGKSPVTIGLHIENTNANWIAADNFMLSYIGKETPTSITDLNMSDDSIDINNSIIYNMSGQRLNTVQKGINIINGKKVYIK